MQTRTYFSAIATIIEHLRLREIVDQLAGAITDAATQPLSPSQGTTLAGLLMDADRGRLAIAADPVLSRVAERLPLPILKQSVSTRLVATAEGARSTSALRNEPLFWTLYFGGRSLIETDATGRDLLFGPAQSEVADAERVLPVFIADFGGGLLPLQRLTAVLLEFEKLYSDVAEALAIDPSDLRVAFLDSGSDLQLGLAGTLKVIEAIERVLNAVLTHLIYRQHMRIERDLATVVASVQALDLVREGAESSSLSPEVADRIRRTIEHRVEKLVGMGAGVPNEDASWPTIQVCLRDVRTPPPQIETPSESEEAARPDGED